MIIPIKWKEVVFSSRDLEKIYARTEIQRLAFEEIEKSVSLQALTNNITEIRDRIIYSANKFAKRKILEVESACNLSSDSSNSLKREVDEQILKSRPDTDTIGGRLVNSLLTTGVACALPSQKFQSVDPADTDEMIQSIFDRVKVVEETRPSVNVYLFNPGKNTLTRVDIELMQKQEIAFERNWTFEASWCELTNGNIFFCGGNGLNNSEVLMIDAQNREVTPRKNFSGRSGHAIIEIEGSVYVFGGSRGIFAEMYNFIEDEWHAIADLPSKLQKTSICKDASGIMVTGNDCSSIYHYITEENIYKKLSVDLELYKNKNKIVFSNDNITYCMCGDKLYFAGDSDNLAWEAWAMRDIPDRDWWSYTQPVIYNGCAYFIKYFMKNLWRLNLSTFELTEIPLEEMLVIS